MQQVHITFSSKEAEMKLSKNKEFTAAMAKMITLAIKGSESGGSVSCEAHRPIEELKKEFDDKFTLLINDPKQPYRIMKIGQSSETLWQWIETEILKVR